jgi:ligand-binding SRPBCC domain-containing protein
MRIQIRTKIDADFETVVRHFDKQLLTEVSPAFPPTRLLRYDGNQPGSEVHVELNFMLFRQVWKSRIISFQKNDQRMIFIDEGIEFPFFLAYWHHEHIVEKCDETTSQIVDDIHFRTPFLLTDYLMYPLMYFQFWGRKSKYQKFFRRL